jgi:hypothetical protein
MILPDKHLTLPNSLIGSGARVLDAMSRPVTVSRLWDELRTTTGLNSYWRFILVLDFLFAVGAISFNDGLLSRASSGEEGTT